MPRSQSPAKTSQRFSGLPTQSNAVAKSVPSSSPVVTHTVEQPGFFASMKQGFGLGVGQSLAFNLFRSDPVVKHVHVSSEYTQCMEQKKDAEECKQFLN